MTKKIKVEAEVTTKKNISSGIGKGFGTVIGIFLGLIFIGIIFGIMLTSNADDVDLPDRNDVSINQITQNYEQAVEKEVQKIEKEIEEQTEELLDEILPDDERNKEKNEEFSFSPESIVESKNGLSLSLDDFKYEIKGDNWGKIIEITITVLNEGNNDFTPEVLVMLHDDKDRKEEWFQTKDTIEFDIFGLSVGEHITKTVITDISFNDLDLPKELTLILTDYFDYNSKVIISVEKEFMAE